MNTKQKPKELTQSTMELKLDMLARLSNTFKVLVTSNVWWLGNMAKSLKTFMNYSRNSPWPKPHMSLWWRAALCQSQNKGWFSITSEGDYLSLSSQPKRDVSSLVFTTWLLDQNRQPKNVPFPSIGKNLRKRTDFTTTRLTSGVADFKTLEYSMIEWATVTIFFLKTFNNFKT